MTARDYIQTSVAFVRTVDGRPRAYRCRGVEARSKIEFVLMLREPQPDLRRLPDEQIVDAQNIGAKEVN